MVEDVDVEAEIAEEIARRLREIREVLEKLLEKAATREDLAEAIDRLEAAVSAATEEG